MTSFLDSIVHKRTTGWLIASAVPEGHKRKTSMNQPLPSWPPGGEQAASVLGSRPEVVMTHRSPRTTRRHFVQGTAAAAGAITLGTREAEAGIEKYIAQPPAGFSPLSVPGKITKVSAKGDFASFMQPNQLWPKPEVAKS